MDELTTREREIFDLVLLGYINKQIAVMLGTSHQTVKNQVSAILEKKDMPDRITMILQHYGLPSWMD